MNCSKMFNRCSRLVVRFAIGMLILNIGLAPRSASADTKKKATSAPAPKAAAPAKSSAPSVSHSTTGASHPGGSTGNNASKPGGTASHGTTEFTRKPGTQTHLPNGRTATVTHTGTVTKSPTGKVTAYKGNNGHEAKFGNDGKVKQVKANGMTITHGPGNARHVEVERADHTRLVSDGHGRGYIEHPYRYGGRAYYSRAYYYHGGYYRGYYAPYYYNGVYLRGYMPAYYYPPAYYGWAYNPWPTPYPYAWGWGASPWYGYYGAYFAPYPVYPSPAFWLTDYMLSATLAAAYESAAGGNASLHPLMSDPAHLVLAAYSPGAAASAVVLTPEVKKAISTEIQNELALQKAQQAGADPSNPGVSSLGTLLADGKPHVFVAGSAVNVTSAGEDCSLTDGDVLGLDAAPAKGVESADLRVLASKQQECATGSTVSVQLADLQEMHNHLLSNIDKGLGEMKDHPGQGGLPAPPADAVAGAKEAPYAAAAPPADADGAAQLDATAKEGAQTEQQVVAEATAPDEGGATAENNSPIGAVAPQQSTTPRSVGPQTISAGQTIAEVVAMKGQPKQILNFPAKTIYVYSDMKITFVHGKLTDVQ